MTVDTPYAPVRLAGEADQQKVLEVLTEAFMDDALARWLFPGAGRRGHLRAHFHRPLLTHPAAEAYLAGRSEGASVWQTLTPHEESPDEPDSNGVRSESGARLLALGQALAPRHPRHEPHLYLPFMGVISGRQGAGLGSAMLRHRLERADADGLPAYLEASSPRSRALYQRHGFEDLGGPVQAADSPHLWPMWRPPSR
ncbi:GNAT family N-acetyltransferase [Nonomuraea sp. B10E15]|uniref:GNAT family N-acetyltransferase n=1 Tax=Nonomuraea sp. B10E15 TaxID=3153560 RepID=UPI00325E1771